jgi:hypothetical protein
MSLEAYRPYLGRVITLRGKKWRVASIHADHPDYPWGWMVRVDKPMDQCRLSLRSESFKEGQA